VAESQRIAASASEPRAAHARRWSDSLDGCQRAWWNDDGRPHGPPDALKRDI
jgi:hypothetical protein